VRYISVPLTLTNNTIPVDLYEPCCPVCDDAIVNKGLQKPAKTRCPRREKLGTMVELELAGVASCNTSTNAPRLFKDGYFC